MSEACFRAQVNLSSRGAWPTMCEFGLLSSLAPNLRLSDDEVVRGVHAMACSDMQCPRFPSSMAWPEGVLVTLRSAGIGPRDSPIPTAHEPLVVKPGATGGLCRHPAGRQGSWWRRNLSGPAGTPDIWN